MANITLSPGQSFTFDVGGSGRYLLIRYAGDGVTLGADTFRSTGIQTGDAIDVEEHGQMWFTNPTAVDIDVQYQIADLRMATNATQNLVIQRIIDPIQFEASVHVVDGLKVNVIAPTAINNLPDITIQPGESVKVTSLIAGREKVAIQVISEAITMLRVGGSNVAANIGSVLSGSIDAPASMTVDTSGDVWVYNAATTAATVSVSEVIK